MMTSKAFLRSNRSRNLPLEVSPERDPRFHKPMDNPRRVLLSLNKVASSLNKATSQTQYRTIIRSLRTNTTVRRTVVLALVLVFHSHTSSIRRCSNRLAHPLQVRHPPQQPSSHLLVPELALSLRAILMEVVCTAASRADTMT